MPQPKGGRSTKDWASAANNQWSDGGAQGTSGALARAQWFHRHFLIGGKMRICAPLAWTVGSCYQNWLKETRRSCSPIHTCSHGPAAWLHTWGHASVKHPKAPAL